MTLAIRPARPSDIPRLQEIERAAAELFRPLGLLSLEGLSDVVSNEQHRAAMAANLSVTLTLNELPIGYAMGRRESADAYLHQIDTHPDHQRQGHGARTLNAYCEAAKATGAKAVILSTFRDVPWNAPFYRKHAFADIPRTDYLPWMHAIEAGQAKMMDMTARVFMRRPL